MKYDKILIAASMAMLVWSCSDDNVPVDPVAPTPGADVQFGAALDVSRSSRTVYGDLTNGAYPILWSNGDQVKIMSPQCYIKQGVYKVDLGESTSADKAGQLKRVGDVGIQWGDATQANFYSVYPESEDLKLDVENRTIEGLLEQDQTCYFTKAETGALTYVAVPDMSANIMTAATYDAPSGQAVNLLYKSLSTALRITLNGPTGSNNREAIVSRVRIKAPQPITGKYTLTFPETVTDNDGNPTISMPLQANADNKSYDLVNIVAAAGVGGGYLSLGVGETVELNAFIMLTEQVTISDKWSLEVVLSDGTVFTKALGGTGNMTLIPGQIHRLPEFPALDKPNNSTFDVSKWMTYIPRNIYLSEISIPGSWNSLNGDFQSDLSIENQYKVGVRAFHLDTRWKRTRDWIWEDYTYALGTADGGSTSGGTTDKWMNSSSNPTVEASLDKIIEYVKSDEYMVLMCTFAQNSASHTENGLDWMGTISALCDTRDKVYDARNLKPETTVGDVLGKVIVIINTEDAVAGLTLPQNSKCLFVNVPMEQKAENYGEGEGWKYATAKYNIDYLYSVNGTQPATTNIYFANTQAQISSSKDYAFTHSQRGYAPTLAMRQEVGDAILTAMQGYYTNINNGYQHNAWIYLCLGGYQINENNNNAVSGSYKTVTKSMNKWLNDKLLNMTSHPTGTQTSYYPVGLVFMNFVNTTDGSTTVDGIDGNTYTSPQVVSNILELNNKYQKAFDSDKDAWPSDKGNSSQTFESAAPGYSSGFNADTDNWSVF